MDQDLALSSLPMREFVVTTTGLAPVAFYNAHVARLNEIGALELLVYAGERLWPIAMFAPGQWASFTATVPDEAGLRQYVAVEQQQQSNQRAAQSLVIPGAKQRPN